MKQAYKKRSRKFRRRNPAKKEKFHSDDSSNVGHYEKEGSKNKSNNIDAKPDLNSGENWRKHKRFKSKKFRDKQRKEFKQINDDIVKQLEIQRAKRQKEKEKNGRRNDDDISKTASAPMNVLHDTIGNFKYDAECKAYFPVKEREEAVCKRSEQKINYNNCWKRPLRKNACQYIISAQKDLATYSSRRLRLFGMECSFKRRIRIVHNSSHSLPEISSYCSIVAPIFGTGHPYYSRGPSFADCVSKEHMLHPTSRSFDVVRLINSHDLMPNIATIVGDDGICFRPQQKPKLFSLPTNYVSSHESTIFKTEYNLSNRSASFCKCIRFYIDESYFGHSFESSGLLLGILTHDTLKHKTSFSIARGSQNCSLHVNNRASRHRSGDIFDFCFLGRSKG